MRTLLHDPAFAAAVAGRALVLVDAGARGELDPPWAGLGPEVLTVVGFEPDAEECRRLQDAAPPGRRYLPVALWSHDAEVQVHVAATPSCSSVHPPNERLLRRYADPHVRPRDTAAVERYPARPLDAVLDEQDVRADVLKVDVQGAEAEILRGAARALRETIDVAIVETWTVEVHRGQGRTHDVLALAADAGLSLFDVGIAAAWERRSADGLDLVGKRQVVGLDLLLIRDPADWPADADPVRRAKAAAVAEAFGFPDVALELLPSEGPLREAVLAGAAERRAARDSRWRRVRHLLGKSDPAFASLHA